MRISRDIYNLFAWAMSPNFLRVIASSISEIFHKLSPWECIMVTIVRWRSNLVVCYWLFAVIDSFQDNWASKDSLAENWKLVKRGECGQAGVRNNYCARLTMHGVNPVRWVWKELVLTHTVLLLKIVSIFLNCRFNKILVDFRASHLLFNFPQVILY